MTGVLVVIGAMIGAPLRYLTDQWISARHDSLFPWGTLAVNAAGSLLLGFLAAGVARNAVPDSVMAGLGVGFCGALTTYSTFSYETVRLAQEGARLYATLNIAANTFAGLTAASTGALAALTIWH